MKIVQLHLSERCCKQRDVPSGACRGYEATDEDVGAPRFESSVPESGEDALAYRAVAYITLPRRTPPRPLLRGIQGI